MVSIGDWRWRRHEKFPTGYVPHTYVHIHKYIYIRTHCCIPRRIISALETREIWTTVTLRVPLIWSTRQGHATKLSIYCPATIDETFTRFVSGYSYKELRDLFPFPPVSSDSTSFASSLDCVLAFIGSTSDIESSTGVNNILPLYSTSTAFLINPSHLKTN